MGYCSDPVACRPVHGIEATGGSFPARIWAAYMTEAVRNLPVKNFPVPKDLPDEKINASPAPAPLPVATPTEKPTPKPKPKPKPTPPPPAPSPPPAPTPTPTVLPTGG
jgi:membrane peptidoglycan carboxypeptidase